MLYRLNTPTLGIVEMEGRGVAITIPAGSLLSVSHALPEMTTSPPIEVLCSGMPVRMFPIDIVQRAEEVTARA